MTGFGESERALPVGKLAVQVRTVNHRFLNVQFRMPSGWERHQPALERILKTRFVRGHVNVTIVVDRGASGGNGSVAPVAVDVERARSYVTALRDLQDELGLEGKVEVGILPWFREIFRDTEAQEGIPEIAEELICEALEEAAGRVQTMRMQEGARLAADLDARLAGMEVAVESVAKRAPERLVAERDRLRTAIQDLIGAEIAVDEDRIAREVAHLAERWDIHEELVRFRSHLDMFRDTMEAGDPAGVGKRFGFISQEMLREANTMGSKANDAEIAGHVVALKEEIERLREQLENVE
ncbi:MAG: YicC/YloC family endoribonuclease [Gemmatimonadota bacterium]